MIQEESLSRRYYVFSFIFTVITALFLLFISCFLPQSRILTNISNSIGGLNSEGLRPYTFDLQDSGALDTYTDIEMLRATASTHKEKISSIFTNDFFYYKNSTSVLDDLESYVSGADGGSINHYVRYWMGFRVFLRFALVFLNYFQIRAVISVWLFSVYFLYWYSRSKSI